MGAVFFQSLCFADTEFQDVSWEPGEFFLIYRCKGTSNGLVVKDVRKCATVVNILNNIHNQDDFLNGLCRFTKSRKEENLNHTLSEVICHFQKWSRTFLFSKSIDYNALLQKRILFCTKLKDTFFIISCLDFFNFRKTLNCRETVLCIFSFEIFVVNKKTLRDKLVNATDTFITRSSIEHCA